MSAESKLNNILKALEGVTVLEAPRVSRETIIATLREHTNFIRDMRHEVTIVSQTNKQVAEEAAENRMYISQLKEESLRQQKGLDALLHISEDIRKQITSLNERMDEFPILKQAQHDQKIFIEDLALKFHVHVRDIADFTTKTNKFLDKVDQKCVDNQYHTKELEDYVNHLPETLILPSSQIRVETTAGFSDRPIALVEVLSQCNTSFDSLKAHSTFVDQRLLGHDEEINKKAPETIIFQVHDMEKKVHAIEFVLEREEDQGIGAVRRQVEQLTSDVQSITSELHDKIDKDSVSLIVHEKYDEIVRYLQDALQSSAEDEQNFKAKADELQEMLFKLANSKCDRTEIVPMQEMLVKTEAMIRKLSLEKSNNSVPNSRDGRNKDINANTYNKKEIEAMLELKVDKETFEQQLQSLMKMTKKNRRLSSLVGAAGLAGNIIDQAVLPLNADINTSPTYAGVILDQDYREETMWKGLADVMREESDASLLKSQILSKMNQNHDQNRRFGRESSSGKLTGPTRSQSPTHAASADNLTASKGRNNIRSHRGSTIQSASDKTFVTSSANINDPNKYKQPNRAVPNSGLLDVQNNEKSSNEGSFVNASIGIGVNNRSKGDGSKFGGVILASNPSMPRSSQAPGVGITGNPIQPSYLSGNTSMEGYRNMPITDDAGDEDPMVVASHMYDPLGNTDLLSAGQDMSFMGAQIAGGGYNLKSSIVKPQSLKSTNGFADNSQDLEASGFLVKGQDGKLYYSDEPDSTISSTNAPTSKKLLPKTKEAINNQ